MDAGPVKLLDLIADKGKRFIVPVYQRPIPGMRNSVSSFGMMCLTLSVYIKAHISWVQWYGFRKVPWAPMG